VVLAIATAIVLALVLAATVVNAAPLPTRARWVLALLALIAGTLVMLRRWGRYD
jgi:hypothetical protein